LKNGSADEPVDNKVDSFSKPYEIQHANGCC
jgi:hypothetical protein